MIEVFSALSAIAAVGALIVSIISLCKSHKVERLQKEVAELDAQLKEHDLEAIKKNKEACVEARLAQEGKSWYLKIFNKGEETAFDIDYLLPENCGLENCFGKAKTPFPALEQWESYEENVLIYLGFPSMIEITTTWQDGNGNSHSRVNRITKR